MYAFIDYFFLSTTPAKLLLYARGYYSGEICSKTAKIDLFMRANEVKFQLTV